MDKKLGKLHLLNKVVRIELKDEVLRLKQLEMEKNKFRPHMIIDYMTPNQKYAA
ncbi:MAG: hypothetical protein ABI462_13575 [Ignavibacteria bacterium]